MIPTEELNEFDRICRTHGFKSTDFELSTEKFAAPFGMPCTVSTVAVRYAPLGIMRNCGGGCCFETWLEEFENEVLLGVFHGRFLPPRVT